MLGCLLFGCNLVKISEFRGRCDSGCCDYVAMEGFVCARCFRLHYENYWRACRDPFGRRKKRGVYR